MPRNKYYRKYVYRLDQGTATKKNERGRLGTVLAVPSCFTARNPSEKKLGCVRSVLGKHTCCRDSPSSLH